MEKKEKGVFYIAFGEQYLEEAAISACSVRSIHPEIPTAVATDVPDLAESRFDIVVDSRSHLKAASEKDRYLKLDRAAYYIKILPLLSSPFEKTIFLDSDTWVNGDLEPVFDLLDKYPILVTPAFVTHDYAFERESAPFSEIPEAFGYFNTGFFAYQNAETTQSFIRKWQDAFENETASHTVNDQPALRLALFREDIPFHVIPGCYNTISWAPFVIPGGGCVVVLHGRNPWLQKWCHHFKADKPTIVGKVDLGSLFRYHCARVLYWLKRKLLQK